MNYRNFSAKVLGSLLYVMASCLGSTILYGGDEITDSRGAVGDASGNPSTSFRSFEPDSLVAKTAAKRIPVATGWCMTLVNSTGSTMSMIELVFSKPVSLTFHAPFPKAVASNSGKAWLISGQEIAHGDSVTICGVGPKTGTQVTKWRYTDFSLSTPFQSGFIPPLHQFLLPMPNAANVRIETFALGGFSARTSESDSLGGMVLGTSFLRRVGEKWKVDPDSGKKYGWVRLKKHSDVQRSLEAGSIRIRHTGPPRGFCFFDNGRPFLRQASSLPAVKMNNRLFAQLVALKMSIAASTLGITPVGFGELIYDDNGHPFDELAVKQIADWADVMMTYCHGRDISQYYMLDSVLTKINRAFSGPIDTISFGATLRLTGVRDVSEVPFLKRDPDVAPTRIEPASYYVDYDEAENEEGEPSPPPVLVSGNYPNPFNPSTTIHFTLRSEAILTMRVFNMLGQLVAMPAEDALFFTGENEIAFDARLLPSGVYFYQLEGRCTEDVHEAFRVIEKMVYLK